MHEGKSSVTINCITLCCCDVSNQCYVLEWVIYSTGKETALPGKPSDIHVCIFSVVVASVKGGKQGCVSTQRKLEKYCQSKLQPHSGPEKAQHIFPPSSADNEVIITSLNTQPSVTQCSNPSKHLSDIRGYCTNIRWCGWFETSWSSVKWQEREENLHRAGLSPTITTTLKELKAINCL